MPSFTKRATIGGLILTLKEGEKVSFNDGEVTLEVVQIQGRFMRIAIKANEEIRILRIPVQKTPVPVESHSS